MRISSQAFVISPPLLPTCPEALFLDLAKGAMTPKGFMSENILPYLFLCDTQTDMITIVNTVRVSVLGIKFFWPQYWLMYTSSSLLLVVFHDIKAMFCGQ